MGKLFAIFMALTAYTLLSVGIVLMKKGVPCLGWKGKKERRFYSYLGTWVSGFLIMNLNGIPNAIALKTLPPHIVSASAGWGIIVLIFFSSWLLKEKIYKTDYLFTFLIVLGIFVLNFFEQETAGGNLLSSVSFTGLIILSIIPFLFLPLLLFKRSEGKDSASSDHRESSNHEEKEEAGFAGTFSRAGSKKLKTVVYAVVSGLSAGLLVVFLKMLVLTYGFQVGRFFGSVYLYLYIFFALLSVVALQFANKSGDMIVIGPVQYTGQIVYPALSTYVVFGQSLAPGQAAAIFLIIYSVNKILQKH